MNYEIYTVSVKGTAPLEIFYNRSKYLIDSNDFSFHSEEKLSLSEIENIIKGTNNVTVIRGNFKNVVKFNKLLFI